MSLPEWMTRAACTGPHAGRCWVTDTDQLPPLVVQVMADICAACPVLAECAAYVEEADIAGGFWAGADRTRPEVWVDQPLPLPEPHRLPGGEAA